MKRKLISLLFAAAFAAIMIFACTGAQAKTITPNVVLNYEGYEFTGRPMGPGLKVYDENGALLEYKTDYTLAYNGERIYPGTYSVTVSFIGEYEGTEPVTKEFYISENKVNIKLNYTSYEFANKPLGPGATVTDSKGKKLEYKKDYIIEYGSGRIEPGTYTIKFILQGNYYGTFERDFKITENNVNIKLNYTSYEFANKPLGPGATITDSKGKKLEYKKDYIIEYGSGRIEPGTYTIKFILQGDYRGEFERDFKITENNVNIKLNYTSYEFANKPLGPGATVTDSKGKKLEYKKDYIIEYGSGRIEPGTYTIKFILQGDYRGEFKKSFSITENKVNVIPNYTSYEYTGTPLGPGVKVYNSKGKLLTANTDYTVRYNGERIEPGRYSVSVILKGNYRGTGTAYFTIESTINHAAIKASANNPNCTRYTYGKSVLGYPLDGFIINGNGRNNKTIFMDFAVHGFEDEYANDGRVLVALGNELVEYYSSHRDLLGDYKMVIVPCANPDGVLHGKNNYRAGKRGAFGRCTYDGIDMNRDFGSGSFKAVESRALRDFMRRYTPDMYLNFHGWENSVIGNPHIVNVFRTRVGIKTDKSNRYGADQGYIIAYTKNSLNSDSALIEFKNTRSVYSSKVIAALNDLMR